MNTPSTQISNPSVAHGDKSLKATFSTAARHTVLAVTLGALTAASLHAQGYGHVSGVSDYSPTFQRQAAATVDVRRNGQLALSPGTGAVDPRLVTVQIDVDDPTIDGNPSGVSSRPSQPPAKTSTPSVSANPSGTNNGNSGKPSLGDPVADFVAGVATAIGNNSANWQPSQPASPSSGSYPNSPSNISSGPGYGAPYSGARPTNVIPPREEPADVIWTPPARNSESDDVGKRMMRSYLNERARRGRFETLDPSVGIDERPLTPEERAEQKEADAEYWANQRAEGHRIEGLLDRAEQINNDMRNTYGGPHPDLAGDGTVPLHLIHNARNRLLNNQEQLPVVLDQLHKIEAQDARVRDAANAESKAQEHEALIKSIREIPQQYMSVIRGTTK